MLVFFRCFWFKGKQMLARMIFVISYCSIYRPEVCVNVEKIHVDTNPLAVAFEEFIFETLIYDHNFSVCS